MIDQKFFRLPTAAAFSLLVLAGCGRSKDEALTPVPAAVSSPAAAAVPAQAPTQSAPLQLKQAVPQSPVPPGVDPRKPIATVNEKPIPAEKVYSVYRMNQEMLKQRGRVLNPSDDQVLRAQSLEVVIADELLYQAALAKGVTASPPEVDEAVKQLKTRVGSEAAYKKFLVESGLTEAEVRAEVMRNLQTDAYGKGLVAGQAISEEQAKKFYDANVPKGMFNVPEQAHVQYILLKASEKDPESVRLDAKKRAEEAAKRAAAGEDFAMLAKEYSQDPTAVRGGDIGFFPRGVMYPKFEEMAFTGKLGDITPLFETPNGFNVMKVLERKPESTRAYEEVKNALMLDMGRVMQQDAIKVKIRELAAVSKIAILDPTFAPPAPATPPAIAGKP